MSYFFQDELVKLSDFICIYGLYGEIRKNVRDAIFKEIMAENVLELKYLYSQIKDHPPKFQAASPFPTCTRGYETGGHKGD